MGFLIVFALFAADTSQWSGIRELKRGDRVGVVQADMKRVEGRFDSATDDAIVVDGVTLSKDRVVRVYRRPKLNRVARTVIGTLGQALRNEGNGPDAGLIAGLTGAAGAGVGAASGGGYKTVYHRLK